MKKVLGLMLGASLALAAVPSYALDPFMNNVGVYGTALYTKPSNNGLGMGTFTTGDARYLPVLAPSYGWDFNFGISYHFPCTSTRLFFDYERYTDSDLRRVDGAFGFVTPPSGSEPAVVADLLETAQVFRLRIDHAISIGCQFFVNLSGFFEYNKLSRAYHEWDSFTATGVLNQFYIETNNHVHGWGPGVGLDLSGKPWICNPAFTLFLKSRATVFYGENVYTASGISSVPASGTYEGAYFEPESSHSLVAKFDIDLGIDYSRKLTLWGCPMQSGIAIGMRYINIVNAFKNGNIAPLSYGINNPFNNVVNFPILGVPNDWGRLGPYIKIRVGGADA